MLNYAAMHPIALESLLKELKDEQIPPLTVLESLVGANPDLELGAVFDYLYNKLDQIQANSTRFAEKLSQNEA